MVKQQNTCKGNTVNINFAKDFSLRRHANDFRFIFYNMAMYNIYPFPLSIDRSIHGQYKRRDVQRVKLLFSIRDVK